MPAPRPQGACACGGVCPGCQSGRQDEARMRLATGRVRADDAGHAAVPPGVGEVLRSPGQALDAAARGFMEARFGHDFGKVRVHADERAGESARSLNALAYTAGEHIVFQPAHYAPGTERGRRLLAHELTHVLQQSAHAGSRAWGGTDSRRFDVNGTQAPLLQRQVGTAPSAGGPPAVAAGAAASPRRATVFTPGVMHNHRPSGRWADVQANPNSGFLESTACRLYSAWDVVRIAMWREFSDKPLALSHLNWYLMNGHGHDYNEDANLRRMLYEDGGIRILISAQIGLMAPATATWFDIQQGMYHLPDFRYSYGNIDRMDMEVDFTAGTVHVWFQDRYEWHPVYPFYTFMQGDERRDTNCVHAALVEMKRMGARDYWMKGEATVPLSLFTTERIPARPRPAPRPA